MPDVAPTVREPGGTAIDAETTRRLRLESLARDARKRIARIVGPEALSTDGPRGTMADILEALEWYVGYNQRIAEIKSSEAASEADRLVAASHSTTAGRVAQLFEDLTGERPATERSTP
jgi:hypothetical protein